MTTLEQVTESTPARTATGWAALPRWARLVLVAVAGAALPVLLGVTADIGAAWYRAVTLGVIYAMAALSLNLLMGYAGQLSLGHTAFMAVGAYAAGLAITVGGGSFVVGFIAAGLVGALFAFLVGLPALRLRGLLLAVTTLAFLVAVLEAVLRIDVFKSGSVGAVLGRPSLGPITLAAEYHYLAFVVVLLVGFWALDGNVTRSGLGRAFLGIREDEQVAASYGIDIARTKLTAFVLSGAAAGIAGAALGHFYLSTQTSDFELELSLAMVAWVVIGGLGHRGGVVVSAALFGFFPFVFTKYVGSQFEDLSLVIGAALFLLTVAINPNGFVGNLKEKRDEKAAERAKEALARGEGEAEEELLPSLPVPAARHGDAAPGSLMLEVTGVTVRFGGLTAVDNATLDVRAGEIVGLIGPNGAGKTTLFDAIGGYNQPETASVRLRGRELSDLPPHDRADAGLGRTFQRLGLASSLSVRDNLLLAQHSLTDYDVVQVLGRSRVVRRSEHELRARADEVIDALGFARYADLPVKHLSGGQRRITEMACTLVTAPDLLMLDEPTAGMAPAAVENLAVRLRELRDVHRRTILLIEHHVPLVLDVCDRIYVLDHGRIIATGSPDEILRDPEVLAAYLGERAAEQAGLVDEEVPS